MKYCFFKRKNSKQGSLYNPIGYNIAGLKSISLVTIKKECSFNKYKKCSILGKAIVENQSFGSSGSAYLSNPPSFNPVHNRTQPLLRPYPHLMGPKEEIGGLNKDNQQLDRIISRKKKYTSYSKLSEVKLLTIGLASPLRILQWAEKTLPNGKIYGEVLNANTLHHKTFKPQKGGLFCERIFGPLKDFECACGKKDKSVKQAESLSYKNKEEKQKKSQVQQMRKFCPDCDVEYTRNVIRRYQLGYIKLISPVTHIWFLKGSPSYLSLLLDIKKRHLQYITYCSETLTLENSLSSFSNTNFGTPKGGLAFDSPSKIFESWQNIMAKTKKKDSNLISYQSPSQNSIKQKGGSEIEDNKFNKKRQKNRIFKKAVSIKEIHNHNKDWKFYQQQIFNKLDFSHDSSSISDYTLPLRGLENFDNVNQKDLLLGTPTRPHPYGVREVGGWGLNLLVLLNALNLSVYYQSMIVKKEFQSFPFNYEFSNYIKWFPKSFDLDQNKGRNKNISALSKNQRFLEQPLTFGAQQGAEGPLAKTVIHNPISFKSISKKLPIDLFILCSIEQAIYKQTLSLAIKKAWYKIFKQGYIKAILKAYLISQNSKEKEKDFLNYPIIKSTTNLFLLDQQKHEKNKQKELEKMDTIFRNIFNNEKKEISKQSVPRLALVLNMIKKIYQKHVLFALKKVKQPIFSTIKAIQLKYSSQLIIDTLSDEISNYLMFKTNFIKNKLTRAFLKPLLFVKYLFLIKNKNYEILNTLSSPTLTHGTAVPTTVSVGELPTTNNYGSYDSLDLSFLSFIKKDKKGQKAKENTFYPNSEAVGRALSKNLRFLEQPLAFGAQQGGPSVSKKYPLSKDLIGLSITAKNSSYKKTAGGYQGTDSTERLFNNFYTLSHRERWDNEKDWQVFLLYNSAIADYTDLPIPAYKKRLFSTSPYTGRDPFKKDDLILSNAFYSGPGIVKHLIDELNFAEIQKLDKQNRLLLYQLNKIIGKLKKQVEIFVYDKAKQRELKELCKKRDLLIRRTKLVRKLFRKESNPSSMILTVLPVLPPDLRPIVKMGGQIAASDLNRLYQRVIYRNERLKKFLKDPATSHSYEMKYAQRLLQEAVDNLIQNGKSGVNSEKDSRGRILKSLSDNLKGKQGRFRQFLLGKRVDYSGRSVIVVGPKLKLHECGIPIEMAKELYLPFILKAILNKSYAKTVVGAKTLMKKNPALVHELLREIMQVTPVLLNRAPTLHRLGIQAFVPKLVEGRAILLHPLVCSAFNADFDGDQMAVHVPITIEARAEAWKLMLSRNNILSPATGDPLAIPSQDMVLGSYYLTTYSNPGTLRLLQGTGLIFNNFQDVMKAYQQQQISNHALIWVKWNGIVDNGTDQEEPIEIRISNDGTWQEISSNYYRIFSQFTNPLAKTPTGVKKEEGKGNEEKNLMVSQYIATTPGRILWNLLVYDIIKQ
jgi:DNA-directed RNA polymerase beta' subunit